MRNLQTSTVPYKSAIVNFKLGASEQSKEVTKHECNHLCTIAEEAKIQASTLFQRKNTITKQALKATLKFKKSLVNSLLIKPGQSINNLQLKNTKSRHVSTLIAEENISNRHPTNLHNRIPERDNR